MNVLFFLVDAVRGRPRFLHAALDALVPVGDLAIRLWVAHVFFKSGLTKLANMDTTILLFTHEYQVPLLSPTVAAYLGTGAELVLPVLVALGLVGRLSALALFAFNIVAVISYPDLNAPGLEQHILWGLLLLVPTLHGPGRLSLDYLLGRMADQRP